MARSSLAGLQDDLFLEMNRHDTTKAIKSTAVKHVHAIHALVTMNAHFHLTLCRLVRRLGKSRETDFDMECWLPSSKSQG